MYLWDLEAWDHIFWHVWLSQTQCQKSPGWLEPSLLRTESSLFWPGGRAFYRIRDEVKLQVEASRNHGFQLYHLSLPDILEPTEPWNSFMVENHGTFLVYSDWLDVINWGKGSAFQRSHKEWCHGTIPRVCEYSKATLEVGKKIEKICKSCWKSSDYIYMLGMYE